MYEAFFNLHKKPFELVPNPSFLFMSAAHKKALNYLTYGIRQQSGFILLTGEVGAGKTTLIRRLIRDHLSDVTLSKVFNTKLDARQLLEIILEDFGIRPSGKDKPALLRELNEFLIDQYSRGRQCVLIIDEAQNLDHELLEEVRLLSNLENDHQKLLHIILVGQPELKQVLAVPALLQLRQRIQVSCHIPPLHEPETSEYIAHRLEEAGNRNAIAFEHDAYTAIYQYTQGIPRLINILCDYLLLDAFANESREISAQVVHEVAKDLNFDNQYWNPPAAVQEEPTPQVNSHGPSLPVNRASAKITMLLKNLNGRLKNIEDVLPRIEAAGRQQPSSVEQGAVLAQLASLQESLQGKLDSMWGTIGNIAGEVHALKERLEKNSDQSHTESPKTIEAPLSSLESLTGFPRTSSLGAKVTHEVKEAASVGGEFNFDTSDMDEQLAPDMTPKNLKTSPVPQRGMLHRLFFKTS